MIRGRVTKRFAAAPESAGFQLDVEIEAHAGVTVLYGPSGSGKTLTLDCIAGFARPDTGRILLDDRILFDAESGVNLRPQQRSCGYVFQNYALFPHMTLRENLAFAAYDMPRLERHRRLAEQLERFKLTELAGRYPHELSGGQKQRGSIARALISNPRIVLLDEPGRGLDAELRTDLYTLIEELKSGLGMPVLLVTHDPEECFALADHVFIYEGGRIAHRGSPDELLRNPGTSTAAELLGGFTILEAEVAAIDPAKQTSRLLLDGEEIQGPHLRGCFKGDRIALCTRPEELFVRTVPGANRVRRDLRRTLARPQFIRAEFSGGLVVDVPREEWQLLREAGQRCGWWVEIPATGLRQITGARPKAY
ncbi:MAG TPA: ATP-binding cassette domain-containing protein [Bryobacteraceae bacterium]|nr:ATP-binding cassette domain-containing protein [Bryobacteraceae bacterium]